MNRLHAEQSAADHSPRSPHAPAADRLVAIDALRGVAILGIFAVNIFAFAYPWQAIQNPALFPDAFDGFGQFWWTVSTGLFQFKFITIFSTLFGAGIALMLGEEPGRGALHRRRMIILLMIGLFHNYVLWYGDILVPYALIGLVVAGARFWSPRTLFAAGAALIVVNAGVIAALDATVAAMPPAERAALVAEMWSPPPEVLAEAVARYRADFLTRFAPAAGEAFFAETAQLGLVGLRISGLMLVGMALFKVGFFSNAWRPARYFTVGLLAATLGAAASFAAAGLFIGSQFDYLASFRPQAMLYWGSLVQSLGYACLVMGGAAVGARHRETGASAFARLCHAKTKLLAAAGRMALSNYLLCSLIGVGLFYGPPGLGLFARLSFETLALIVGLVWALILTWSPLWLSAFRFGPAEWAWRSLTYGERQPLRRPA